jgi:hypothetical protein
MPKWHWPGAALACACAFGLAACGASKPRADSGVSGAARPVQVAAIPTALPPGPSVTIATIGNTRVTKAALAHLVEVQARAAHVTVPDPPGYNHCIAQLAARKSRAATQRATLKSECEVKERNGQEKALEYLISSRWIIEESRKLGVASSQVDVNSELERELSGPNGTRAIAFLKSTGTLRSEALLTLEREADYGNLAKAVEKMAPTVTRAMALHFYTTHRRQFFVPELRNVEVLRNLSRAVALKARREGRNSAAFKHLVNIIPVYRPDPRAAAAFRATSNSAPDKLVLKARVGEMLGPVKSDHQYYTMAVKSIIPAHTQSFHEVEAEILKNLSAEAVARTRQQFISGWRRRWTAKTRCGAHFVVQKCSEFGATGRPVRSEPTEVFS